MWVQNTNSKFDNIAYILIKWHWCGFQVVSRGEAVGPEGVVLMLKKAINEELVQQTTSTTGGDFVFEKVLPGEYVIDASRDPWLFDVVWLTIVCCELWFKVFTPTFCSIGIGR